MAELEDLKRTVRAHQVCLVVDGMIGQESVRVGQAFAERIGVDGLVLTKMDGDARGGAALSLRQVTGKPILFLGVGEKLDGLEVFSAERLAGRILGMGDVVGPGRARAQRRSRRRTPRSSRRACARPTSRSRTSSSRCAACKQDGLARGHDEDAARHAQGALAQLAPQKDKVKHYEAILLSMTLKERRHAAACSTAAGGGASRRAAARRCPR